MNYLAVSILFLLSITSEALALPSFQEVKDSYRASDAVLLDRHGKVIHELRVNPVGRRLDWVGLADVSPAVIKAVIHSEDKRFYEHNGVDWIAVGSAVIRNIFTRTTRGASTITMQVVSLLDDRLKPDQLQRTLGQKWQQMRTAQELEKTWSKNEIIEAYLNLLTFRGELQGIAATARGLFDKDPSGLNEPESIILSSLIRAPNASTGKIRERACLLGASMKASVGCEELKSIADKAFTRKYSIRQRIALAHHLAHQLLDKAIPSDDHLGSSEKFNSHEHTISVKTTLDGDLQRFVLEALRHHVLSVKNLNVGDGAVLVVDNRSGDVLAYVGGIGEESSAPHVDGIRAKRQAGSSMKPFLYADVIEKQILTAASLVSDSPVDVPTTLGIYRPENYENDYKGMVTVRTALASSLNVPAVRTLSLIGTESFAEKLRQLGFQKIKTDDFYGFSLALGSADVSLYDLVNAYRTLANGGVWSRLRLTFDQDNSEQRRILSEETAFLISDILSDRHARSYTFSLENPLSTKFWSAVKTGTSKDMRDNWCIGYTQNYTVGVWVGNSSGAPMWNVSGVTGAAPIWLEIMNYLYRDDPSVPPLPPNGLAARSVDFQKGAEPSRTEWFIRNTEPANEEENGRMISRNSKHEILRITYPSDGLILAIDPDIPVNNQSIFFETKGARLDYEWTLNGKRLCKICSPSIPWTPAEGKYILSLVDKQDRIIDTVRFEVRGSYVSQE